MVGSDRNGAEGGISYGGVGYVGCGVSDIPGTSAQARFMPVHVWH
ncbi:hypothetical protein HSR121_2514 [Halapricum desulfuricans]|uniref:Uncharacterized protein n=1 Tax=Halapricum desulfuricans TaxID=2841257 RepID=A0A897N6W4_9EURY|nr:hypothetical protein HSR121_2514 [Halapricum desulfuricans]